MVELCQKYFYMALEASAVILVVLAIRPFIKKISNRIACLLWAVVLLRLMCPVTIVNPFVKDIETIASQERVETTQPVPDYYDEIVKVNDREEQTDKKIDDREVDLNDEMALRNEIDFSENIVPVKEDLNESSNVNKTVAETSEYHSVKDNKTEVSQSSERVTEKNIEHSVRQTEKKKEKNPSKIELFVKGFMKKVLLTGKEIQRWFTTDFGMLLTSILGMAWFIGMIGFLVVGFAQYIATAKRIRESVPFKKWNGYSVKLSDLAGVPMSFGIIHKGIYVPLGFQKDEFALSKVQQSMILWHESMHLKHSDPLWKAVAFLALSVHWWNPLVWVGIRCLNQDLEMACDENVLEMIGQERKQEYASTLLEFATNRSGISLTAAFGESHAESRIKNVIRYRKSTFAVKLILSSLVLTLGGCLATTTALNAGNPTAWNSVSDNDGGSSSVSGNDAGLNTVSDNDINVEINETNFPDPAFREYVNGKFDKDNDGVLSTTEIQKADAIICEGMNIQSLSGIEFLPELYRLDFSNNLVENLDISKNPKLRHLDCSLNPVKELDISNCAQLVRALDAGGCYGDSDAIWYEAGADCFLKCNQDINITPEYGEMDLSVFFGDVRDKDWKEVYADVLEKWLADSGYTSFGLIYVNDDEIPELAASTCGEAGGNVIFSIVNGKVVNMHTSRLGFYYKEYGNVLNNSDGHMGYYYDFVYRIGENGFELIHNGEYHYYTDSTNRDIWTYNFDGEEVTKEEYEDLVDAIIPGKDRNWWEGWVSTDYNQMLQYLKGETAKDYREAYKQLIEKGIYFDRYTMTSKEENRYLGYALIERKEGDPLLLCVNDRSFKIISYDNGLICNGFELYIDPDEFYLYPEYGMIESYGPSFEANPENIYCNRYYLKNGTVMGMNLSTNDNDMVDHERLDCEIVRGDRPIYYRISYENVSKEEFEEYYYELRDKEKFPIYPYGDPKAQITYMTEEELLNVLAEQ